MNEETERERVFYFARQFRAQRDLSLFSELHRIAKEIAQYLSESRGVPAKGPRNAVTDFRNQLHSLGLRCADKRLDHLIHGGVQIEDHILDREFARLHFRNIENIF